MRWLVQHDNQSARVPILLRRYTAGSVLDDHSGVAGSGILQVPVGGKGIGEPTVSVGLGRRILVLLPPVVALAFLLLFGFGAGSEAVQTESPSDASRSASSDEFDSADRLPLARSAGPEPTDAAVSRGTELRVLDSLSFEPIQAAVVYRSQSLSRFLPSDAPAIGVSNADGVVKLDQPGTFIVAADGYVSQEALSPAGESNVLLSRGVTAEVRCLTLGGGPVSGAVVHLSQWADLDSVAASGDTIAGGRPRDAIYSRVTNAAGVADFAALEPGNYIVAVSHPDLVFVPPKVRGGLPFKVIAVPGSPCTVHLREPYSAAVIAVDARIVYYNIRYPIKERQPASAYDHGKALKRFQDDLRQRFGEGARVCVTLPREGAQGPPIAHFDCLLKEHGWVELAVPLRPISELRSSGPTVLTASTGVGPPPVRVTLSIVQSDGRPVPCDGELTFRRSTGHKGLPIMPRLRLDEPTELPPGEYRVYPGAHPCLAMVLAGRTFTVEAGSSSHVALDARLDTAVVSKRLVTVSPSGSVGAQQLRLKSNSWEFGVWVKGSRRVILPVGTYEISSSANSGFETGIHTIVVDEHGPEEIRLEYREQ